MIRQDLIKQIARKLDHLPEKDVELAVKMMLDQMTEALPGSARDTCKLLSQGMAQGEIGSGFGARGAGGSSMSKENWPKRLS